MGQQARRVKRPFRHRQTVAPVHATTAPGCTNATSDGCAAHRRTWAHAQAPPAWPGLSQRRTVQSRLALARRLRPMAAVGVCGRPGPLRGRSLSCLLSFFVFLRCPF